MAIMNANISLIDTITSLRRNVQQLARQMQKKKKNDDEDEDLEGSTQENS